MKQLVLDLTAVPQPALENFVSGRNTELVETLRKMLARGLSERFLYLWGGQGSGRSHLLQAVVNGCVARGEAAVYIARPVGEALEAELAQLDCVAVDDVERLAEDGQLALFNLYNALREARGMLLVAGDAPPAGLALRPDLVTRLSWGLVYQVHGLSDAEKGEALRRHAAARGFALSPEVRDYLLTRIQRDMRSLLVMLEALDRYSLATRRAVTVPLIRELLAKGPDGAGP